MEVTFLDLKWNNINFFKDRNGFKALRVSADCKPDLFLAIDEDGKRCLILFLPEKFEYPVGTEKDKLKLVFIPSKKIALIKLEDMNFLDLFNDLIISIHDKIKSIEDNFDAAINFISIFSKWAHFFEDVFDSKLNKDQIKGLFGELSYLLSLLKKSNQIEFNGILSSWNGPHNTTNDFIFDKKNIEVKTKRETSLSIRISSEFQLEKEFDKGLELLVISIKYDLIEGQSINDLIKKIVTISRANFADLSIFYKALGQFSITTKNAIQYNNYKFTITEVKLFDVNNLGFPKISKSDLPSEITKLKFTLRVSSLDDFLLYQSPTL